MIQRKPNSSSAVSTVVPMSFAALRRSSSVSETIWLKSAVASFWKTIPPTGRCLRPSSASSVIWAVEIANRRSGAGFFRLPRPPSSASRKPKRSGGGAGHLRFDLLKLLDPLLDRRVVREDRPKRALDLRRHDEEGAQLLRGTQVLARHLLHPAGDLHQRRYQRARAAGDQRRAAVGGELAVTRQGQHQ